MDAHCDNAGNCVGPAVTIDGRIVIVISCTPEHAAAVAVTPNENEPAPVGVPDNFV